MHLRKVRSDDRSLFYLAMRSDGTRIWHIFENDPISGTMLDLLSTKNDERVLYTNYYFASYAYFHEGKLYEVLGIESSLTFETNVAYHLRRNDDITIHQIVMMELV